MRSPPFPYLHENLDYPTLMRAPQKWEARKWSVVAWPDLVITTRDSVLQIDLDGINNVRVRRGLVWWRLVGDEGRILKLRGIGKTEANNLRGALRVLRNREKIEELTSWYWSLVFEMSRARQEHRWFPSELLRDLEEATPPLSMRRSFAIHRLTPFLTPFEKEALAALDLNFRREVAALNKETLEHELKHQRHFLATIESSPLTREQAEAVITYDSRVQLLAAAGSGKTSVMIARAAYAVKKGLCDPSRILLLAFNKAAAEELQQRVADRFEAAGIDSRGIRASTFHSLGLTVIGKGTGSKPRLASWLENGRELDCVLEIVDELRDSSPEFRYKWDLYRLVFAPASIDIGNHDYDGYDKETRDRGFRTLRNDLVKSQGERMIADFLFLNGVEYEYEKPYIHDVADADHRQYRPDFFYPEKDIWHEHLALDAEGKPPAEFPGYMESLEWKRKVHQKYRTHLIETTWAKVMFRNGLTKLQRDLEACGLTFDWNPDRPIPNTFARPVAHQELAKLVRTFMAHIKSSSLTPEVVIEKLRTAKPKDPYYGSRSQLFLDIFWPILEEWNRRLAEERAVDFEDMLLQAAKLLEQDRVDLGYDLVLVDELQDSSRARAEVVQGLLRKSRRFLLAVGDDWQSINRFAGSDISVMRTFESWFGESTTLALTKTFRCPHSIAEVSSSFVSKNPAQLKKKMVALRQSQERAVKVLVPTEEVKDPVLEVIKNEIPKAEATVLVLARYNFLLPSSRRLQLGNLEVSYRTVHSSKGLEADYVVVDGLTSGRHGFPSTSTDDPVLALAMPEAEIFPYAEERRLFYVALTRARKQVFLITSKHTTSPFVAEILGHPLVQADFGEDGESIPCPKCGGGLLVKRNGPWGDFLGCSKFPSCDHSQSYGAPSPVNRRR